MLKKSPAGPSVGEDDVFAFNDKFVNKQLKIKINSVQSRESVEEQKETAEKVFADRQYVASHRCAHCIIVTLCSGTRSMPPLCAL